MGMKFHPSPRFLFEDQEYVRTTYSYCIYQESQNSKENSVFTTIRKRKKNIRSPSWIWSRIRATRVTADSPGRPVLHAPCAVVPTASSLGGLPSTLISLSLSACSSRPPLPPPPRGLQAAVEGQHWASSSPQARGPWQPEPGVSKPASGTMAPQPSSGYQLTKALTPEYSERV